MNVRSISGVLATALLSQALLLGGAVAAPVTYGFNCITNNSTVDCQTGEAQLSVAVDEWGTNQVSFYFTNSGPSPSSITDIYFDLGALPNYLTLPIDSILNGSGVSFSIGASPSNLPGGNTIGFTADSGGTADSNAPTQPNGVNPGEWLRIIFDLASEASFQDVLNELNSTAADALRIGIHVQGFANGGSESFVNDRGNGHQVPEPATLALLGLALAGLGLARRWLRS
jgi:hypothetical protein